MGRNKAASDESQHSKQVTLFYSYSHRDEKFRDALAKHLALLKRQGLIKEWYDRQIDAGEEWRDAIDEHLEAADIILLLVSSDFIGSDYCFDKEMGRALERHDKGEALVIPIIVRPVSWSGAPFGRLQALPKDGKPVTIWDNRDLAWVNVAEGITKMISAISNGAPIEQRAKSGSSILPVEQPLQPPPKVEKHIQGCQRIIYTANYQASLPGKPVRSEGQKPSKDSAVNEAYDNLGTTYGFFWDNYQRDSIDGQGMQLSATVHYEKNYSNAFWNGKELVMGDGDGQIFNRFSLCIDVVAKELSKGLIEFETGLSYWGDSGAIIESMSDVFGLLVKQYFLGQTVTQADWLVGQGLFTSNINGVALRSLKAPGTAYDDAVLGKDPQPAHMRDYIKTKSDNEGIHINSGIPNHAFYLIASEMGGFAWEKAGRIWYTILGKLHGTVTFLDFARLTHQTAGELFGSHSTERQAVKKGWAEVGIRV